MFPEALDVLCGEREFDPRRALAMIPMNAYWQLPKVLKRALDKEEELYGAAPPSTAKCSTVFWRYARFKSTSSASWTEIAKLLRDRGFDEAAASERAESKPSANVASVTMSVQPGSLRHHPWGHFGCPYLTV